MLIMNRKPLLLTRYEAADLLGISYGHLRQLIRNGEIPSVKLGRRVKIPLAAIKSLALIVRRDAVDCRISAEKRERKRNKNSPRLSPELVVPETP